MLTARTPTKGELRVGIVFVALALALPLLGASGTAVGSATASRYEAAVLGDQPRGFWRLAEADGATTAVDASGQGNHGTYANVGPSTENDGAVLTEANSSARFHAATDSNYMDEVRVGVRPGLAFGEAPFTIEAWVRTSLARGVVASDDDGTHETPPGWVVYVDDQGRIASSWIDSKFLRRGHGPSTRVDDDEWHHVVVVFAPGSETRIYVDRVGNGKPDTVTPYVAPLRPPGDPYDTIGVRIGDATGYPNFVGDIDEVAMYASALPASRVRAHFAAATDDALAYPLAFDGQGANAWWRLGDPPGAATAADETGNGSPGTYRNVQTGVPGALANDGDGAARFPGTTATADVLVPDGEVLNAGVEDFSVTAWIKTTATGERAVVTKEEVAGPGWAIAVTDDAGHEGRIRATVRDGTASIQAYGPATRVDDGAWHHVALVVARSEGVRLYVDARERETAGAVIGDVSNTTPLRVGGGANYAAFSGDLDEVALYQYALGGDEIAEHYEAGAAGVGESPSDPVEDVEDADPWTDDEPNFDADPVFDEGVDEVGSGEPETPPGSSSMSFASASAASAPTIEPYCGRAGSNPAVCVRSKPTDRFITWQNRQALWTIYKGCYGPARRGTANDDARWRTVGPGYIARVQLRASNSVIVDDERGPEYGLGSEYDRIGHGPPFTDEEWWQHNAVNSYIKGGLGTFAWHHARASKRSQNGLFEEHPGAVYTVEGRICADDFKRSIGGAIRKIGVLGASVGRPVVYSVQAGSTTIPVGSLRVDVFFTDGFVDRIVRVRYLYLVYPRVVRAWYLTTFCYDGCHLGSGTYRYAFIKEPKFTAVLRRPGRNTNKLPFIRVINFEESGIVADRTLGTPPRGPWCVFRQDGGTATNLSATNHCGNDARARARFDFGGPPPANKRKPPPEGHCSSGAKCLNVVMRSYPVRKGGTLNPTVPIGPLANPGRAARRWEGAALGLDQFARITSGRPKFNPVDDNQGNPDCVERQPPWRGIRRWELIGGNKDGADPDKPYHATGMYFHGWEGGVGFNDCELFSGLFPFIGRNYRSKRETYAVHAQYSINSGWSMPPRR